MRERLVELLDMNCGYVSEMKAEDLADYLIANGVVIPPCEVGDVVYDISDGTPYKTRIICFAYFGSHWACRTVSGFPDLKDFGKRIFLTEEEAEAALKRSKQ